MGTFKKTLSFCLMVMLSAAAFAKQLSFQIVQHDSSSKEVTEQSLSIEDVLINSFFEQGYIVTNSPTVSSASESQDENFFKTGIGEAFDGYSDYFVQIKVFYAPRKGTVTNEGDIEKIEWTLSNAKTGILLSDQIMESTAPVAKASDTQKMAVKLVGEINKALKANKA